MKKTREQKQVSGFLKRKFTYNGMDFKPLTARSILLLEQGGSTFGDGKLSGLFDVLYISATDNETVLDVLDSGTFRSAVLDFADQFTTEDMDALTELLNGQQDEINANIVDVKETSDSKK